jgi:hypothetical protein
MPVRRSLTALCMLLTLAALAGCAHAARQQPSIAEKLLGTWYDSRSGSTYRFMNDSILVVPHTQSGGGNAATYRILSGNKLDIVSNGSHHVSVIETVSAEALTLADPVSGFRQRFFRNMARTQRAKSIEASALTAVSNFATTAPEPEIVWVAKKPTGKGNEWTDWAPTTLSVYATAWDWTSLKRDKAPGLASGSGDAVGYSFSFLRKIPTAQKLEDLRIENSIDATAGQARIDVGYSASKAQYPAGTLVYLPGGLIYSLGNGYAIAVGFDRKAESFMPLTHR